MMHLFLMQVLRSYALSYIEFVERVPCLETSGLSLSVIFDRNPAASFIPSIAFGT